MSQPIEQIAALTIGTVESVSPTEIRVLLEPNAPQATALNTGVPTGFPRINGYVLIPNETGAVVGLVVSLGVERSQFPKRPGLKDFGLVDLPFPLRKISLTPLGTLLAGRRAGRGENAYRLERGVSAFPSVGDAVLLPTAGQLRSIIEASSEEDRRVKIGTSPLAANAAVTIDPDKIFGRHLAVLGNTGSGKSCSVAGLIRWSLETADNERSRLLKEALETAHKVSDPEKETEATKNYGGPPNARFIILDPNGEYSNAFEDYHHVRRFQVSPKTKEFLPLLLPAWMWNSHEWCAFTEASSKVQRPILMRALRELRVIGDTEKEDTEVIVPLRLRLFYRSLIKDRSQGPPAYMDFPGKQNFGQKISAIAESVKLLSQNHPVHRECLLKLHRVLDEVLSSKPADTRGYYPAFDDSDIEELIKAFDGAIKELPMPTEHLRINEDSPVRFDVTDFAEVVEQIAIEQGQVQFVDTLLLRVRMLLSDERLRSVVSSGPDVDLSSWLENAIGENSAKTGCISILDLSLLSSDILHTIIAVVARIVFEATQRYRKLNGKELPTVLVLEEAHTFVKRGSDEESNTPTPSQMCRQTFERIAREGRKFGLGLVLSSQRPSELSSTVLAQCNTFLLHRIVNDRDQELVGKLVPDNLGGLLKELPSLPSRQAILLGWAATVPTLVEITELPEKQRPRSSDPKFWDVWTGEEQRPINWRAIVDDWTGVVREADSPPAPKPQQGSTVEEQGTIE
jgi:DNA helicase HerA-like ATPase